MTVGANVPITRELLLSEMFRVYSEINDGNPQTSMHKLSALLLIHGALEREPNRVVAVTSDTAATPELAVSAGHVVFERHPATGENVVIARCDTQEKADRVVNAMRENDPTWAVRRMHERIRANPLNDIDRERLFRETTTAQPHPRTSDWTSATPYGRTEP